MDAKEQLKILKCGAVEIIDEAALLALLTKGVPLRVKCGFDPTAADLHLGHAVLLRKLKQFQDLGHHVTFLIGDFTARIGDPTGRNSLRPALTDAELATNVQSFREQVHKILNLDGLSVIRENSRWFEDFLLKDVIQLLATTTVSQMLEREDFNTRFNKEQPIHLHELIYPLLQGFDSVMLGADVEIGGTDQKFNLLMGRELQRKRGREPQIVMTMPLINGTDGVQKMSKSLGNHIGIAEQPNTQFAQLMSVPDDVVPQFRELLTDLPEPKEEHPLVLKKQMAHAVVEMLHGVEAADRAQEAWVKQFQERQVPEMDTVKVETGERTLYDDGWIIRLDRMLVNIGLAKSNTEANRKIKEGAVWVDGVSWMGRGNSIWVPKELPVTRVLRLGRNWKRVEVLP